MQIAHSSRLLLAVPNATWASVPAGRALVYKAKYTENSRPKDGCH